VVLRPTGNATLNADRRRQMKADEVLLQRRPEMDAAAESRSDDGNAVFAWRAAAG
jgi:hypothetical protein